MALVRFARVDGRMPPSPPGWWQVTTAEALCKARHYREAGYNQWAGMKKKDDLKLQVSEAILACQDKQADNVTVLELEKDSGAFTDYFVMCSGSNSRQIQAIADAVDERLEALGMRVTHAEGYKQAEWVLLDYVDFVVHVFSEKARQFYDLERLWKSAKRLEPAELMAKPKPRRATTLKATAAKSATGKAGSPAHRKKKV
jgi:ribosome-associated protein